MKLSKNTQRALVALALAFAGLACIVLGVWFASYDEVTPSMISYALRTGDVDILTYTWTDYALRALFVLPVFALAITLMMKLNDHLKDTIAQEEHEAEVQFLIGLANEYNVDPDDRSI